MRSFNLATLEVLRNDKEALPPRRFRIRAQWHWLMKETP